MSLPAGLAESLRAQPCKYDRLTGRFGLKLTWPAKLPLPADDDLQAAWPAPNLPVPYGWGWAFEATRTDTADGEPVEPGRVGAGDVRVEISWRLTQDTRPRRGRPYGHSPHPRRILSREFLAQVADVYRAAIAAGRPPLSEIADRFDAAHPTAAGWVKRARSEGLLEAAVGTKPGEADPQLTRNMKANTA